MRIKWTETVLVILAIVIVLVGCTPRESSPNSNIEGETPISHGILEPESTSGNQPWRYRAQGTPIPVDFMSLLERLPQYSTKDDVLAVDPYAYYAGDNGHGGQYIVSENRELAGVDGIVLYFLSEEGYVADISFRTLNATYADFLAVVQNLAADDDIPAIYYSYKDDWESTEISQDMGFEELAMRTDITFSCQPLEMIIYVYLSGVEMDSSTREQLLQVQDPPDYGQRETIYNELTVVVNFGVGL